MAAALNRALEIARRKGDAPLEMRTLCNAARVDAHQGRPHEALKKSLLALELAPRADDLAAEADAHYQAGNHLITLGDPEAARYHLLATSAPAVRANDYYSTLNILVINIRLSMLVGDWVVARELSDRALAIAPLDARLLFMRIMLEYQEGDFVQGWGLYHCGQTRFRSLIGPLSNGIFASMAYIPSVVGNLRFSSPVPKYLASRLPILRE